MPAMLTRPAMASAVAFVLAAVSLACASASTAHSASACVCPSACVPISTFPYLVGMNSCPNCALICSRFQHPPPQPPIASRVSMHCFTNAGPQGFCPDLISPARSKFMVPRRRLYDTYAASLISDYPAPMPYPCNPPRFAFLLGLVCSGSSATKLGAECCETVLQVDQSGGLPCLCASSSDPVMSNFGFTVGDALSWYTACGGLSKVDPSDVTSTCSGQGVELPFTERSQQELEHTLQDGAMARPEERSQQQQQDGAMAARPLVVVIPYQDHSTGWPWWAILLMVMVLMFFIMAMAYAFAKCIRWLADYVMWVFFMGRRAANERGPTTNTNSTNREIVPETAFSDVPSTEMSQVRDLVPTEIPEPGGPPPTSTHPVLL